MPLLNLDFPSTEVVEPPTLPWPDGDEGSYRDGYDRALYNILSSLVPLAEQHLRRSQDGSAAARRNVYAFIEFLENHIERASAEVDFVADGLGI